MALSLTLKTANGSYQHMTLSTTPPYLYVDLGSLKGFVRKSAVELRVGDYVSWLIAKPGPSLEVVNLKVT